jgi:hypothetical protein
MANQTKPVSSSSQVLSPALTAANLAAHQRAMTTAQGGWQGGWVCGGEMYHRPTTPTQEQWNLLVKRDLLAADIDDILRAATDSKTGEAN